MCLIIEFVTRRSFCCHAVDAVIESSICHYDVAARFDGLRCRCSC
jgi:hypothetical protein